MCIRDRYIIKFSVRGIRKEAGTAGDETNSRQKRRQNGYVRTKYRYTYMNIYTGMEYLFFSVRGAREEAGTVGDNEVEAIAAAKWSRTDEIYMHISIERRLYINILT